MSSHIQVLPSLSAAVCLNLVNLTCNISHLLIRPSPLQLLCTRDLFTNSLHLQFFRADLFIGLRSRGLSIEDWHKLMVSKYDFTKVTTAFKFSRTILALFQSLLLVFYRCRNISAGAFLPCHGANSWKAQFWSDKDPSNLDAHYLRPMGWVALVDGMVPRSSKPIWHIIMMPEPSADARVNTHIPSAWFATCTGLSVWRQIHW